MEWGFSGHKVKEVSNPVIKSMFLRPRGGVVGAFARRASLLRTVRAFTESPVCVSTTSLPTQVLPLSRTRQPASPSTYTQTSSAVFSHRLLLIFAGIFLLTFLFIRHGGLHFLEAGSNAFWVGKGCIALRAIIQIKIQPLNITH